MTTIKIHEQIAFLRKQNGLTQEDLAIALGVTNQSVSKWESAQCCPDIQLLPKIAKLFHVSVDSLLGYHPVSAEDDIMLDVRTRVESLNTHDSAAFTRKAASILHAAVTAKHIESIENFIPDWNAETTMEKADKAQWGFSCFITPEITTVMRKGTVLFSNNDTESLQGNSIRHAAKILKDFANTEVLTIGVALYQLTCYDEKCFVSMDSLRDASGLSVEIILEHLEGPLAAYVIEDKGGFQFNPKYMHLIPLFTLLNS